MSFKSRLLFLSVCITGLVLFSVGGAYLGGTERFENSQVALQENSEYFGPPIPPEYTVQRVENEFPEDSTLQDLLFDFDFTPRDIHQLITDTKDVYNLNRVAAGNRYALERDANGRFRKFEYDVDDVKYLVVTFVGGRYKAELSERVFETSVKSLYGQIRDSLWNNLTSQGESGLLVMNIHELMQWDIDFTTIQPNDSYKIVFEKKYYRDEFVKYGDILAMEFTHGGRQFYAFQFDDPKSGKKKYYDYEGKGVKKAFLKVPFKYDYRISSGFSHSRLHPVSRVRRPHYGIDYAAPTGTPVLASASGRVVFAGRKGGNGNMVTVRHPNGYATYYLHLSKIRVKSGQSIAQGDVLGNVGSTGIATGPHLDYRIQDKRGNFINPKKYISLPSDVGVAEEHMEGFIAVRDALLLQLQAIPETIQYPLGSTVAG